MQRPRQGQVIIGVDTHKEIHVAAAVDWRGTLVGEECFPTTRRGYRLLESWARSLGGVPRVGVERSGPCGSGLTRHLAKNGFAVPEVTFPDKTARRKRGKDDFIDAEMAAEASFTGARTVTPKSRDGMVEPPQDAPKDWVDGRSGAEGRATDDKGGRDIGARGAARPAARHDAHAADKAPGRDAAGPDRLRDPARRRQDSPEAPRQALSRPGRRGLRARRHDRRDAGRCRPLLVQLKCVGAQSAAQLMVTVGDNPERLRSEASFVMLCGVAPVPVSSGMTYRHRFNRGGDRQTPRSASSP